MSLIGAMFNQEWGTIAGFALVPVLVGMMVHMMLSGGLGAMFAWTSSRMRGGTGGLILRAVVASLVVWLVADFLILPLINPIMTRVFPDWLFAVVHVVYGLGPGGYLAVRGRRAAAKATEASSDGAASAARTRVDMPPRVGSIGTTGTTATPAASTRRAA